jgi:hypothetical protein
MKKNKNIICLAASISLLCLLASCRKDFEPGNTVTQQMANEWWCRLLLHGQDLTGYQKYATYNSANGDSLWVDDFKNGYGFKIKAMYDATALSFSTGGSANAYYVGTPSFPQTAKILDGKVFPGGGKSTTGVITDSIYFKIIFSDSPADTFVVAGTARTNWAADDH